ncbi:shikimate kinase [Paenibacillus alkalitolerans]|uniref:shikimate kinase n=1 Tax=Paenibacillus alkalitolerans TaxID=2799335 RepID=UPI001F43E71B|nr:shikimate kinase [Paenibacillus alkalitolerans]
MVTNIILVGFMGTGKSTVGQALSERLGWKFVDTDRLVEEREKRSIAEIFARDGEGYFRDAETAAIREAAGGHKQIISTGGGAVLREENRRLLQECGFVVALKAPAETIIERLRKDTGRPLLKGDKEREVRRLMENRKTAYDFADVSIDTSVWNVRHAVERIIAASKIGI